MALIGINNPGQYQGRTGTLDRIAKGVDIATKILGTGLQAYKTVAADIPQAQAQADYYKADAAYKQQSSDIELAKLGWIQFDPDHIHSPDLSSGPGATTMTQGNQTVQTNSAAPDVVKIGSRHFMRIANREQWTDATKSFVEGMVKQGYSLTSDSDPDPTKRPYHVPDMPFPMNFKQMKLDPEKATTIGGQQEEQFLKSQEAQRFNNVDSAANMALSVSSKNGQSITKSDDIALTMASIKAMNPDSNLRFSNENIEGFKGEVSSVTQQLVEEYKRLFDPKAPGLPEPVRAGLVATIGKLYQGERPRYDQAYNAYKQKSAAAGIEPSAVYLPPVQFPGIENMPAVGGAKSEGMLQERQKSAAGVVPQFPAPHPTGTPRPNVLDSLGKKLGLH